ncbi:MAG: hypothetical protein CFE24_12710 [Flavobacterium sp. BFFFF2]|nr:MAG: hypothetical protein CFE24_12710 [Flavobacterium sp. BFFFF2]
MGKWLFCFFVLQLGFSQETLLPFRQGTQWGLCNEQAQLVHPAVYDSIDPIDYGQFFKCYKNGQEGVMYQRKTIILPKPNVTFHAMEAVFIVERNPAIAPNNYTGVYNLKGEKIIDQVFFDLQIVPKKRLTDPIVGVIHGPSDKAGVFVYNEKTGKLTTWLFKDKNEYFSVTFSAADRDIHIYRYHNQSEQSSYYKAVYQSKTKKYALRLDPKAKAAAQNEPSIEVTEDTDRFDGRSFYEVKNNYAIRRISFATKKGRTTMIQFDGRYHKGLAHVDSLVIDIPNATLQIHSFKQADGFVLSAHGTDPVNEMDKEKVDTIFTYFNYITYKKDNLLGLIVDKKIWEPQFDSIRYFRAESSLKPYFLVSKKNAAGLTRWGVIAPDHQVVLPCEYDEIVVNTAGGYGTLWAIKQEGRYGIANNRGLILKRPQYDRVFPKDLFYAMHIVQNNQYGWYSHDNMFYEPKFPYPIYFEMPFNKKTFLILVDAQGTFKGYAHPNGTLYFKD